MVPEIGRVPSRHIAIKGIENLLHWLYIVATEDTSLIKQRVLADRDGMLGEMGIFTCIYTYTPIHIFMAFVNMHVTFVI